MLNRSKIIAIVLLFATAAVLFSYSFAPAFQSEQTSTIGRPKATDATEPGSSTQAAVGSGLLLAQNGAVATSPLGGGRVASAPTTSSRFVAEEEDEAKEEAEQVEQNRRSNAGTA